MDPIQRLATSLPRWLFVGGVLIIGIFVILLLNPPHSVCDSQFEVFKNSQIPFLYNDPKKPYIKTSGFKEAYERCYGGNSLGACLDLFQNVRKLIQDIEASNPSCVAEIANRSEPKKALRDTQDLMVRLAWGNKPPESIYEKFGWLDNNHMFLFCNLTDIRKSAEGKTSWEQWRESVMASLPNPSNLPRAEIWRRSIFSASCSNF